MSSTNQTSSKSTRSRYSSPSAGTQNRSSVTKEQRNFMRSWLEPPVQNKPSFQDAGLMRSGVLENMAPLGTLPKANALKKTTTSKTTRSSPSPADEDFTSAPAPTVRKTTFKVMPYSQTVALATIEASSATPSRSPSVPALDMEVQQSRSQSPLSRPSHLPLVIDDGADEDYVPKKTKKPRRSTAKKLGKAASEETPGVAESTAEPTTTTRRQSARHKTRRQSSPTPPQPATFRAPSSTRDREPEDKEMADKVVELAVEEALDFHRYPTAFAIRLLYDDYQNDPHFVAMIEDIAHQRADIETLQEFTRLVKEKKKDGARNGNAYDYFVPPSDGSRASPSKAQPAPYADLLTMDMGTIKDQESDQGSEEPPNKRPKLEPTESLVMNGTGVGCSGAARPLHDTPQKAPAASAKGTPGSRKSPRKKHRSDSLSSLSSLSSIDVDELDFSTFAANTAAASGEEEDLEEDGVDAPGAAPTPAVTRQPIKPSHKKPASKKKDAAGPKPARSSNTTQHPPSSSSSDLSMPATVINDGASHQPPGTLKFPSRYGDAGELKPYERKKLLTKAKNNEALKEAIEHSFTREPLAADLSYETLPAAQTPVARAQSIVESVRSAVRTPAPGSRTTRAAKRSHDELDEQPSSPTSISIRPDLDPPSGRPSRAATPTNPRSGKRARGGLRVKTSPMKKKGTAAGVPRSSGDRPSPLGFGPPNDKDDNDDSCYACGGNGELVCCDGCSYAFHFACIDPPLNQATAGDEWYCNECTYRAYPSIGEKKGVFGSLLSLMDRKNSRAFRLPERLRDYFEGVKTGPEGEYEEVAPGGPKTSRPNRKGYTEEPFDFYRIRNTDGTAALCHMCHKAASENRALLPCSECPLNWHLDCLDPPLACPPLPRTFRCPCHADDTPRGLMAKLAPAHKLRKIKGAPVIEQAYGRGLTNNGCIEIEEDSEDENEAQYQNFGRVYRVPERGVKLDFISRVKKNRWRAPPLAVGTSDPARMNAPTVRSLEEQQAALNLAQLSQGSSDGVSNLVRAMVTQASPAVVSLMAAADAERMAAGELGELDVVALESMLAQADAIRASVTRLLAKRGHPAVQESSSQLETTTATPPTDNGAHEVKRRRSNDSAMQLD
ncbi:uncharacterized protein B0I36DRAFT_75884 [Microdochium trichocladiopsis]|uniref:PHD-type domain-containing protein n=1 Tax=Microdochium trichocladiopsis TaxID=1682393 RepID=A0A9P8YF18_9PEZI|nr:uncharacterized protein B0I36DRAFT_75884 [Microdochium trichocladiopsis]KAH7038133.1 hypothetical protein B0I36DRAFT_75884 [Microdochium trichocladiopsis]